MAPSGPGNSSETTRLLDRVAAGEQTVWGKLLTRQQRRLRALVSLRLDHRLQGRIDPSDVIQEAYLEICRKLPGYAKSPQLPLFLWLRHLTGLKLAEVHRRHLGTQLRDAAREAQTLIEGTKAGPKQ